MTVKNQILERINFLDEYKRIGVRFDTEVPNSSGWVQCFSLDRDEKNPSAAINLQNGFYTDLGSGRRLDFFAMMQMFGGHSDFQSTLKHFATQYGVDLPKGRPSRRPENAVTFLPWNVLADRWCEMKSTNREAVQMSGGELCRYQNSMFCIGLKIFSNPETLNADGYVVAQTNGEPIPVKSKDGSISGHCKIKTVAGSGSGLIGEHALLTIQKARESGNLSELVLFKVEGVSDLLALQARIPVELREKLLVITNSAGCSEKPKPVWKSTFEGLKVILIHDCDQPGQKGIENWKKFLSEVNATVKNVILPYDVTANHGKDLKDFFTDGNTFSSLMDRVRLAEEESLKDLPADTPELADDNPERLARLFLNTHFHIDTDAEIWTLLQVSGVWMEYSAGQYVPVSDSAIQNRLVAFILGVFRSDWQENFENWKITGNGPPPKVRNITNVIVSATLMVLRSLVGVDSVESRFWRTKEIPEGFEDVRKLIPVSNGIISVPLLAEEGEKMPEEVNHDRYFHAPTPLFFTTNALTVEYRPDARSEAWNRMVYSNLVQEDSDTGKFQVLRQFLGYCLLPDAKMQKFLILTGEGANGKSAVLEGFSTMLGDTNISNVPLESFGDRFAIVSIQNKLVNIVDDLNETDQTCEGKLKSIVSGASIRTDRKNKDAVSFRPYCRLIFACNTLPRFRDTSDGIWRRLEVIPFTRIVPEEERNQDYVSSDFWEKEKSGIFNWCLGGLLLLQKAGWRLPESESTKTAKDEFKYDTNPALIFLEEILQEDPYGSVAADSVYKSYEKWCDSNGYKPRNNRNFGRQIKKVYPEVQRVRERKFGKLGWYYKGISFVEQEEF